MEVERLLETCPWHKVYDIAEEIWQSLEYKGPDQEYRDVYASELNRLFDERGIGWEFSDDQGIIFRGDETFGELTAGAEQVLAEDGRSNAAEHVRQALRDLSARPADLTGAIHHAASALEATARDVMGENNLTLGQLVNSLGLPKPLDEATTKLWGYASNNARHGVEGVEIIPEDAQLVVEISCALSAYLARRAKQ